MSFSTTALDVTRFSPPRWRRAAAALRDTGLAYREWLGAEAGAFSGVARTARSRSRHALVVASALPPHFDGGVFRPTSWLRYAADNGWRISAVTRAVVGEESEGGRQLAATLPADTGIHYVLPMPLRPSYRLFMQVDGGFVTALSFYRAALRAFDHQPPAVVVATGPSFASFVAGLLLARRFGARLVLDYRDEWTENPFGFVTRARDDLWWERRCLKAADTVFFTTASQLRRAEIAFCRQIGTKGAVLPNGWEPDPAVAAADDTPLEPDRLIIAFTGVLGSMASPAPFLRDLESVLDAEPELRSRVRLRFIGRRLPEAELALADFRYLDLCELIDRRPRSEADRLIRKSHVLLLLSDADMSRYLPGKLFEYLATKRPILVHGRSGESQALVQDLGAGVHVEDGDVTGLAEALFAITDSPPETWSTDRRRRWAEEHTRERMARTFFDRLSDLVAADDPRSERQ